MNLCGSFGFAGGGCRRREEKKKKITAQSKMAMDTMCLRGATKTVLRRTNADDDSDTNGSEKE